MAIAACHALSGNSLGWPRYSAAWWPEPGIYKKNQIDTTTICLNITLKGDKDRGLVAAPTTETISDGEIVIACLVRRKRPSS